MTTTLPQNPTTHDSAALAESHPGAAAAAARRFTLPGDVIARTCEPLPDHQRQAIKWLAGYARQRNLSLEDIGALLTKPGSSDTYSRDSVYQALTGRRDAGSMEKFCAAIESLRRRVEETSPAASTQFIETHLTRRIWRTCRRAIERQKLTFIFGPSQIGKTTALAAYANTYNHGETVFIRMPTRGSLCDLLYELAIRLGLSSQSPTRELRRRIIECFDARTLLIVDECHQCLNSHYSDRALASLEFLREIWDRRKCGMVLCGTNIFQTALRTNRVLRQLWLRGYAPLQLPTTPSKSDLDTFAGAFGLDPAPDRKRTVQFTDDDGRETEVTGNPIALQTSIISDYGLGRWLSILQEAAALARERESHISWGHVIAVHHAWQQCETINI